MPRLTKPLLIAMLAALDAALAGDGFDNGDFAGMDRRHFERASQWVDEELARRAKKED
ncbi:hypothetical protein ACHMW4_04260 [Mesorhizobium sp. UC22_110]|uniref:hypothetical protein n=1 Tax=unclassified Mesorhizobium TaxID=325217 RepID=UPI00366D0C0C